MSFDEVLDLTAEVFSFDNIHHTGVHRVEILGCSSTYTIREKLKGSYTRIPVHMICRGNLQSAGEYRPAPVWFQYLSERRSRARCADSTSWETNMPGSDNFGLLIHTYYTSFSVGLPEKVTGNARIFICWEALYANRRPPETPFP